MGDTVCAHRITGRLPQGRSRDNTWIQALGLKFDYHSLINIDSCYLLHTLSLLVYVA